MRACCYRSLHLDREETGEGEGNERGPRELRKGRDGTGLGRFVFQVWMHWEGGRVGGHQRWKVAVCLAREPWPLRHPRWGGRGNITRISLKWPSSGSLSLVGLASITPVVRGWEGLGLVLGFMDTQWFFFSGFDSLNNPLTPHFYKRIYDNWLP